MDTSWAAESFRGLLLRERARTRLTQRELAARIGVSWRTVQDWEAGVNYPSAERLQALTRVLLECGGFTLGREATEAQELWAAVLHEAPRMRTPFDPNWWALQARRAEYPTHAARADQSPVTADTSASRGLQQRLDWGDAPDVFGFVGREQEVATLRTWVLEARCRMAAVLGMGGMGKTMLTARLAQDLALSLQRIYWRSLRDAPPTSEWLGGAIAFLSGQQVLPPEGEAERLAVLLELLHEQCSLLVLDNFETLLEPGEQAGRYRNGYAGYGRLLQLISEGRHRSCLILTSREAPPELAGLVGDAVRTMQLGALSVAEGRLLLADKGLTGTAEEWSDLISRFSGNGLALKVVGESVREVFGGELGTFLEESAGATFGGIRRVLAEQIARSSPLEQQILRMLAVERQPVSLAELFAQLGPRVGRGTVVEAVEALRRRSLVERAEPVGPAAFTLQSVVLEYVTDRLVDDVADEITRGQPALLMEQPLIKAQVKDYVRHAQERLIGQAVLRRVQGEGGTGGLEQRLPALLDGWRNRAPETHGYGPGNVVNLLRLQQGHLRGANLAGLAIRQAYLAEVELQDASLAGAHLHECVLAEAFSLPMSVALSGDGATLVAGTSAGEVWQWRVADRTPLLVGRPHTAPVHGVALSTDGRLLASGSFDETIRLTETPSGRPLATSRGHTGGVWAVAISADGQLLASGSFDGTIRLWHASSGHLLGTLKGHSAPVWGVALSADGRSVASGGQDGTVRLWSFDRHTSGPGSGRLLATLVGQTGSVQGVALSADGELLASGGMDGAIRVWETPSERLLTTLQGHTGPVWSVALSADGRLLASGGMDGTTRLWDVHNEQLLATLHGHSSSIRSVSLSADGRLLASGGIDGTIRLWETASRQPLGTLQGYTSGIWGVSLTADGRLLAVGGEDGTVRLWDASSGRLLVAFAGHAGAVWGVALSANQRRLASGGVDGTIRLWDVPSRRTLATLLGHIGAVYGVALSEDGRLLASGGQDGTARLWDVGSGRVVAALPGHAGAIWGVALDAAGELLASGGMDGTMRLWETSSGRSLATLSGQSGVRSVAVSASGQLLAGGGTDGTIRLWETSTGRHLTTLHAHTGAVYSVALNADGRLLASSGMDETIRLWQASSGRSLATMQGHHGGVRGVALSADGQVLASGGQDGTARLWEAPRGNHLRTLRSDRRYERANITSLSGVTAAQRAALQALGAVEQPSFR